MIWEPGWRGRAQQYQQFIETTAVRADHLAQRGESALQPLKVNAVAVMANQAGGWTESD